ncbi:LysR family transcriptional regulator [Vibrio agarivorans]|uniref:LysR family transcriptional regulator n=1 Tax=Vibrio agarivorans TaxID=153622 RepID=UPI00222ED910|nr:LysR family transcriptional regulator [Vibrio agarivorans]MDN3659879.1 LysR family transcriptional regulator [Vibrio agarivorans]
MQEIDWQKVDLNLLKVLRVLIEEQNTSKAAERLFVGQPAVSKALQKLRVTFNDELFIRERHGLIPTAYCLSLQSQLGVVFEQLGELIRPGVAFDPRHCTKEVTIALNPMYYRPIVDVLYPRLRAAAPHATFRFGQWGTDTENKLINGQVDVGVNFSPMDISTYIRSIPVVQAEFYICAPKGGTFSTDGVNHQSLAQSPLVLLVMPSYANVKSIAEQYMSETGIPSKVLSRCDNLEACFSILKHEDAGLPVASIVRSTLPDELELVQFSSEITLPEYNIAVHTSYSNVQNPLNRWLLDTTADVIRSLCEH